MTGTEIQCTRTLVEKLDHAKGLLAKAGGPGAGDLAQVLDAALDALITKKDPMKKAERSAQRVAKKLLPTAPRTEAGGPGATRARPAIPARHQHLVFLRDQGQCTHRGPDGRRCPEKSLLQIDHKQPWSLGGTHYVENLQLLCRVHNNFAAEEIMGIEFMAMKKAAALNRSQ